MMNFTPEEEASIINDLALVPWKCMHLRLPSDDTKPGEIKQFATRFKLDPSNKDCCFKILVSDFESVWVGKGSSKSMSRDILANNPNLDFTLEEGISLLQESLGYEIISSSSSSSSSYSSSSPSSSPIIDISTISDDKLVLTVHKKIDFYRFKVPVACRALGSSVDSVQGSNSSASYKAQAAFIHKHLLKPLLTLSGFLIGNVAPDASFDSIEAGGDDNDRRVLCSELFSLAARKLSVEEKGPCAASGGDKDELEIFSDKGLDDEDVCSTVANDGGEDDEVSIKRKLEIEEKLRKQIQNNSAKQPAKKKKKNGFL